MKAYQHQHQLLVDLSVCVSGVRGPLFLSREGHKGWARTHRLTDTVLCSLDGAPSVPLMFSYPLLVMSVVTLILLDCCARHRLWRWGGVPFSSSRCRSQQSGELVQCSIWACCCSSCKWFLGCSFKSPLCPIFSTTATLILSDLAI